MIRPDLTNRYIRPTSILRLAAAAVLIAALFGTAIHFIEPTTFPSVFDGIWWALVTASTVGYGDFSPRTVLGRIFGMLLIITGIGLFTTYITTLASVAVTTQANVLSGKKAFSKKGHLIIIGWNERSKQTILKLKNAGFTGLIVLIDETLELNPFDDYTLHFIRGKGSQDATLIKANIKKAETVLITSDQSKDEYHSDTFTIMSLLAIKGLNPNVHCIAEILTEDQTANAKRAGADTILKTNTLVSSVMERSLYAPVPKLDPVIVEHEHQQFQAVLLPAEPNYVSKDIEELKQMLSKQRYVFIGIKNGVDIELNPSNNHTLQKEDQIIAGKY